MSNRILIVDDSAFMRNIIKKILTINGYTDIYEASNGMEALQKYQECTPDLVTMDITMPIMDGIEALKNIKNFDPNAIVIMMSAMGQAVLVTEAIKCGASDFIVKPFQAEKVIQTMHKYI